MCHLPPVITSSIISLVKLNWFAIYDIKIWDMCSDVQCCKNVFSSFVVLEIDLKNCFSFTE